MTERRPLAELEMRDDFATRHVGPSSEDVAAMLEVVGVSSIDDLLTRTVPVSIRDREPMDLAPRADRTRSAGGPSCNGESEPDSRLDDRHGLLRHGFTSGAAAQRARESGLVHRVHAVPGRGEPGPAGGPAQLPADGDGPDRNGTRQRLTARRGDRCGGSDGDGAPGIQVEVGQVLRRRRLSPAGRLPSSGPGPPRSESMSWSAIRTNRWTTTCSACLCNTRARAVPCAIRDRS